METAESDIMNGVDLAVGVDEAFALVSDAVGLRKWFAGTSASTPRSGACSRSLATAPTSRRPRRSSLHPATV